MVDKHIAPSAQIGIEVHCGACNYPIDNVTVRARFCGRCGELVKLRLRKVECKNCQEVYYWCGQADKQPRYCGMCASEITVED